MARLQRSIGGGPLSALSAVALFLLAQFVAVTSFVEDLPEFLKRRDGHRGRSQSQQQYVVRDYYVGEYEGDGMGGAASAATAAPWIDPETPTNVTVVAGRTAILACVVRELGTASVSWMRVRDYNVLTMNEVTNTKDPRISAIHVPGSDRWAVRVRDAAVGDSGEYECQVTTPNATVIIVNLNVLAPKTTILGPSEVFLSKGSTLNLTCVISRGPTRQPYIIWTHNSKMLKYISPDTGGGGRTSSLASRGPYGLVVSGVVFGETSVGHSGTYKCEPGAAPAAKVLVHVIDGKLPAAMQTAGGVKRLSWILSAAAVVLHIARFSD